MSSSLQKVTDPAERDTRNDPGRQGERTRWIIVGVFIGLLLYGLIDLITAPEEPPPSAPDRPLPEQQPEPPPEVDPEIELDRMLYSDESIASFRASMAASGQYFTVGDAGHGGEYSPGDGERAEELAEEFLDDPEESYWSQPDLPYESGVPYAEGMDYVRPMHAAWVLMTQPDHADRDELEEELTELLLEHATDSSLDFSDDSDYPEDFPGSAQNPIFHQAQWMSRMMKTRDMLGRETFSSEENDTLDEWFYGYANWTAHWFQLEVYGNNLPGRLDRDYSTVPSGWSTGSAQSYDGGPNMASGARAYTNRHAAVASAMSLAANYVAHYEYEGETASDPDYGTYSVDELLDHSRLFVEETLRFSVYPEGIQGDFERGDPERHGGRSAQQGWLYSINVLANLMEMAEYHAARGDMSVWEYGTTEGLAGSEGVPVAGGFEEKNLHFYAWAMSRYVNDGWGRTNEGEPLALPKFYHDVIPAAMASRFAPDDELLEAAWKRDGEGFPEYPSSPQSQGPFPAHHGEGAKMIGLIEHAFVGR